MSLTDSVFQCLPPLAILAVLLFVVEMIARETTWLDGFMVKDSTRVSSIDGLRAFLAYGVVVCHIGTYFYFYRGVPWGPHPNPYFHQAGAASVRLFFMITGYLFWSKAIKEGGRLAPLKLYLNRFRRIMPLYFVAVLAIVVLSFCYADGLVVAKREFVRQLAILLVPGFPAAQTINGFDYSEILRQAWTLNWEWLFYLSLPVFAFAAKSWKTFIPFAIAALVVTEVVVLKFHGYLDLSITANFLVGMGSAHLLKLFPKAEWLKSPYAALGAIALALVSPLVIDKVSPVMGNLLYAFIFIVVLYGNTLFGLLTLKASKILGDVSYSTYLLHMLVLVYYLRALDYFAPIHNLGYIQYWLYAFAYIPVMYVVSLLSFRFIERPWMSKATPIPGLAPKIPTPDATS